MKYRKEAILGLACAALVLVGLYAIFASSISALENRQAYVYEGIRQRPRPAAFCKEMSDDRMACTTNAQRLCRCQFYSDQQDTEMQMLQEEIARRVDEERAVAEAAVKRAQEQAEEAERERATEE